MASNMGDNTGTAHTDMKEHLRTWRGFLSFMKWQLIGMVILLILLAIFRTHN